MAQRLPYPTLCLVTDRSLSEVADLAQKVSRAVDGGANMVQLREKDLPAGELLRIAVALKRALKEKALLFVNDRIDVALACGADGVQLGEEALPVNAAREIAGDKLLIGRSVHSVEGAVEAEKAGADFLIVGTIFPTNSHSGAPTAGLRLLEEVSQVVSIPFLGIGGVDAGNVRSVMARKAFGVAVISAILGAPDCEKAASELRQAMEAAKILNEVVSSGAGR